MNYESVDVTAGLGGFLAFFLLAVALYLLMRNMNARLRRMAYRQEQEPKVPAGGPSPAQPGSAGSGDGAQDGPHLG